MKEERGKGTEEKGKKGVREERKNRRGGEDVRNGKGD